MNLAHARMPPRPIEPQDPLHVLLRLRERRHAAVAVHRALPRIVCTGHARDVAVVAGDEPTQVGQAAADVLFGVEGVAHAEAFGGVGDELHQAHGVARRARGGIEVGFGAHDGEREAGIDLEARRQALHQAGVGAIGARQAGDVVLDDGVRDDGIGVGGRKRRGGVQAGRQVVVEGRGQRLADGGQQFLRARVPALRGQREQHMPGVAAAACAQRAEIEAGELELGFEAAMRGGRAIQPRGDEVVAGAVRTVGAFDEADESGRFVGPGRHLGVQRGRRCDQGDKRKPSDQRKEPGARFAARDAGKGSPGIDRSDRLAHAVEMPSFCLHLVFLRR